MHRIFNQTFAAGNKDTVSFGKFSNNLARSKTSTVGLFYSIKGLELENLDFFNVKVPKREG